MKAEIGKPKREYLTFVTPDEVNQTVGDVIQPHLNELFGQARGKDDFSHAVDQLQREVVEEVLASKEYEEQDVRDSIDFYLKNSVREKILSEGLRTDGRKPDEIRELKAEIDLSPRAHGSGLFQRGETQVLTLATLGTPRERQELDILAPVEEKRYMHHYNFPPFSTGETRFLRGSSRREIGHGALAERALLPVIPPQDEFPYTMRLVSEVLSSNGSTSMASVCGSTLALLDTGVPIKAPVAGIAMGLVKSEDRHAILTDIQGLEDHLGDMDFKVAGTRQGITALQMDIKIKGITSEMMAEALEQAAKARLKILDTIRAAVPEPRAELKEHAPRLTVLKIDPEKIGAIIGPGGKTIRSIQDETGVRIDIEDDGTVFIGAVDGESATMARDRIESLVEEAVVGRIYTGKVVRTTDFGAFVEILPNTDGLVHISQLASERIEKVEDVAEVGDEITVMVTAIDREGKIRLSRQAVLEGWTAEEAIERDRPRKRPSGGRSQSRFNRSRSSGPRKRDR
jgi:polyribonucleotide nucleotidyltransferase